MKRYSKQRETVLKLLQGTTSHPNANTIYIQARKAIPNISLGTVYRNLAELEKDGTIQSFTSKDGTEHYDANTDPHSHLFCTACGRIQDMFETDDLLGKDFIEKINQETNAGITDYSIMLYGKCAECAGNSAK